jgi:hypothetical protein
MNASIATRVDRLPLCAFHHRFVGLVSIGSWFEFFDLFIMGYWGAALQNYHFLTLYQFSELVSAGFVETFFGTILQGAASDYIGRRRGFILALQLYSIFSTAGAFATTPATLIDAVSGWHRDRRPTGGGRCLHFRDGSRGRPRALRSHKSARWIQRCDGDGLSFELARADALADGRLALGDDYRRVADLFLHG